MAKFPGWLVAESPMRSADGIRLTLRCRPAHPSFLPVLWNSISVQPAVLKPFAVLYIWARLLWRGGH